MCFWSTVNCLKDTVKDQNMTHFYCNLNNHDLSVFILTGNVEFVINPDCKTFLLLRKTFSYQTE